MTLFVVISFSITIATTEKKEKGKEMYSFGMLNRKIKRDTNKNIILMTILLDTFEFIC